MEETKIEQMTEETASSVPQTPADENEECILEKGKALALRIAEVLDDRKAQDIKIINVNKKTVIADYFVIAGGSSRTQVNALADEVEYKLGLEGIEPTKVEGRGDGSWVLLDFDSVIVHVFGRESRDFYKFEKLWAEGTPVEYIQKEN